MNAFSVDGELRPADRDRPIHGRAAGLRRRAGARLAAAADHGAAPRSRGEAVAALGINDGPTYTQVRIDADGPKVMEVAARLGGGHDAELCRAALGVDLNGLALAAALGEDVELPEPAPQVGGATTAFLVAPPRSSS